MAKQIKFSQEEVEAFRKVGALGGKVSAERMTPEERLARAKKANAASVEARRKKAALKQREGA